MNGGATTLPKPLWHSRREAGHVFLGWDRSINLFWNGEGRSVGRAAPMARQIRAWPIRTPGVSQAPGQTARRGLRPGPPACGPTRFFGGRWWRDPSGQIASVVRYRGRCGRGSPNGPEHCLLKSTGLKASKAWAPWARSLVHQWLHGPMAVSLPLRDLPTHRHHNPRLVSRPDNLADTSGLSR